MSQELTQLKESLVFEKESKAKNEEIVKRLLRDSADVQEYDWLKTKIATSDLAIARYEEKIKKLKQRLEEAPTRPSSPTPQSTACKRSAFRSQAQFVFFV